MNWKDPWIHQLYFPVTLGKLQKGKTHISASLSFHPTSAANRREAVRVIGLAQEAVMQGGPQAEGGAARRDRFHAVQVVQPGQPLGQGSSEAGVREGSVRRSHSSLCCKTVVEYTDGFMTTRIPHFPCICWWGWWAVTDPDMFSQSCTNVYTCHTTQYLRLKNLRLPMGKYKFFKQCSVLIE